MVAHEHEMAPTEKGSIRRRGLIAGAAALAAGVLATRMGSEAVNAADGGNLILGTVGDPNNVSATLTNFTVPTTTPGLRVKQTGVATPDATNDALQGYATGANNSGSHGRNDFLNGVGTTGVATNGTGVYGQSGSGSGVGGYSNGGNAVYGFANAPGTAAIVAGVFGDSTTTYGLIGRTTAAGYSGLTAITGTAGVAALAATATVGTAYAAYFTGQTVVQGNFFVVSGTKSAAVKDAAGQHRAVYCVESPESWFEDFGEAKLVNGRADVTIDKTFTEIVHTDNYYVYLTAHGDTMGLHVTKRSATAFSVQENQGGTSNVSFSWRLVAKRNDVKAERLEKVNFPKIKIPDESKLPTPAQALGGISPLPKHKP